MARIPDDIRVTIQLGGHDVPCGSIRRTVHRSSETLCFRYDTSYLSRPDAFALCPGMPLDSGVTYSDGAADLGALNDSMPDRWGRSLMLREERIAARAEGRAARTLRDLELLCGSDDVQRQGALRLWDRDGSALAPSDSGVPREVDLPRLLDAASLAERDLDADLGDLFAAGSSLGGARPKASVRDGQGRLWIAKFPKASETALDDVCAWEDVALETMRLSGVPTPRRRLLRVRGSAILLTERFDRAGDTRIPYMSGMSAVDGRDGDHTLTYLDLAEFIAAEGSAVRRDLERLWTHALVSSAIGNTDNHMKNFGLLRDGNGWTLSPTFDVNPPRLPTCKAVATSLDGSGVMTTRDVMECADLFRIAKPRATELARTARDAMAQWERIARGDGISARSIESYDECFRHAVASLTECLAGPSSAGNPSFAAILPDLCAETQTTPGRPCASDGHFVPHGRLNDAAR